MLCEIHFTKRYWRRNIKLSEVQCYFGNEKLKNTYFKLLPLEILEKIYFYNHGRGFEFVKKKKKNGDINY
jgi:hypothetical protein